ncbi:proteasome subunit beta type-1-like [Drosophila hydei]|uniref:Proteasome subunit beta type-1-like n=1 Tax=Drosophila hydei TaxID=7224 RepID=A0A6J1LU98_DROHY|nr:proteasome subunit beta type-1-like [Drosophila hydei]
MDEFNKIFKSSVFGDEARCSDEQDEEINEFEEIGRKRKKKFDPYEANGGTVLAIAGADFAVVACDTRLSSGYNVTSQDQTKLFRMTKESMVASTGCWCDTLALTSLLEMRIQMYEQEHNKTMATDSLAQMISIVMYNRRFFPYFTSSILAGLDRKGKGIVYYFDPVGHYERCRYRALGTSYALLQPCLDELLGWENLLPSKPVPVFNVSKQSAIEIAQKCLEIASDRDLFSGDKGEIQCITKDGVTSTTILLRGD